MSDSPGNEAFLPRDQTPLRTKHTVENRFQQNFTPPPPSHFTPTPGTGGSVQPEGTPMTYDQYLDLRTTIVRCWRNSGNTTNMGPHNKGRLPQDHALKGQTPIQNRPTPTKPKPPSDLGNHSIPPLKGQMGPAGHRQQKVEGGNLKHTRPTTLPGRNWKISCRNYNS